jgi:hypothetical protein
MGLVLCAGPLILLAAYLLWPTRSREKARDSRPNPTRPWFGIALLFAGLVAVLCFEPYAMPARRLKSIEERARPLVAAIDAFDAERGCPPTSLADLVPKFLDGIPGTGSLGLPGFGYQYVSCLTQPRWKLTVSTGGWNVEDDSEFYFDSWTRRWGYSER